MRGYNLSSRPAGVAAYSADKLADDIRGLIRERGAESALVVGHDWGGSVAWTLAMSHPEVVDRLAILDAAHPGSLQKGLRNPRQLMRSWYFFFFALPGLPERVKPKLDLISAATLVIFGQRDRYLGPGVREPDRDDVPNLDRVEQLRDVHHDEPERVTQLIVDFFAPAR